MKLLLDTHYLVWLSINPGELSLVEQSIVADPHNELIVSAISLWEIAVKWRKLDRKGQRKGSVSPENALRIATDAGFVLDGLNADDAVASLEVAPPHNDPFDYMLLVHAGRRDARLLTRDQALRQHPLAYVP